MNFMPDIRRHFDSTNQIFNDFDQSAIIIHMYQTLFYEL